MDKETIIKGCENWVNNHKDENFLLTYSSVVELLAILKEQEAVEPIPLFTETGEESKNYVICGHCKSINSIMPKATKQKYCHECGRPVLWEGR